MGWLRWWWNRWRGLAPPLMRLSVERPLEAAPGYSDEPWEARYRVEVSYDGAYWREVPSRPIQAPGGLVGGVTIDHF